MSDLIDRQAASKFVLAFMVEYCGAAFDEYMQMGIEKAIAIIPSAEPDIVRCKHCIWRLGTDCTRFAETPVTLDDFCSRGERKRSR